MKTKYVVMGGIDLKRGSLDAAFEGTAPFYAEILRDAPDAPKILLVCFAKDEEKVPANTAKVAQQFQENKWQESIFVEVADAQDFMAQVARSDVVYFHGGGSLRLVQALERYPDLKGALRGKTVAGESAGANVLAEYFYSTAADAVSQGLGLIPVKIIPHYVDKYAGKLDGIGKDVELLALPEYEYKVYEV